MTALIAIAALFLLSFYVYVLARRPDIGLMSILAVELYNFTLGLNSGVVGGVHLSPLDLVLLPLLVAGVIRTAQNMKRINAASVLALGYVALVACSVIRGVPSNGILPTLNEARGFVGQLLCMLYFLTAPTDEKSLRRYTRMYLCFGAALCVVAALAAMGLHVGTVTQSQTDIPDARVLSASPAAAIAVCAFLSLALQYRVSGFRIRALPVMFIAVTVYLRERSVWTMLLAGMVALLPVDSKLFRKLLPVTLLAMGAVAGIVIYGASVRGVADADQFSESATSDATWQWRVNGWMELLRDSDQNTLSIAVGKGMGSGYERIDPLTHTMLEAAPHSEYVQEYLRVGVVGILLLLSLWLWTLRRLWKRMKVDPIGVYPSVSIWAIVIFSTLAFGVTYSIDVHSYALLGIASAIAIRRVNAEDYEENSLERDANSKSTLSEPAFG